VHAIRRAALVRSFVAATALPLTGCTTLGYYAHVVHGEAALLVARRPIERVLADPTVDPERKARLRIAAQARAFASDVLGLPRNRSYTRYVELDRAFAAWVVYATPEFSVEPLRHCFPFAGCVAYQGYFDRGAAEAEARRLGARGYDTWIGGVVAYSTLGWFADPILSSMLRGDPDELVATIFHELAHQALYVADDNEFNESFASFVEQEGLREWRAARGLPPADEAAARRQQRFAMLVAETRERLRALYASSLPPEAMRARKRDEFERLRAAYRSRLDAPRAGSNERDAWFGGELNNAALVPFGLYWRWRESFATLFRAQQNDWTAFFAAARSLARRDPASRHAELERLAAGR
jgi:predicted aminopeptidase